MRFLKNVPQFLLKYSSKNSHSTTFTLLELLKILKYKSPIPITELFTLSNQDYKISLLLPKFNLDIGLQSYVFSASRLWNQYAKFTFEICSPYISEIVIPGSVKIRIYPHQHQLLNQK